MAGATEQQEQDPTQQTQQTQPPDAPDSAQDDAEFASGFEDTPDPTPTPGQHREAAPDPDAAQGNDGNEDNGDNGDNGDDPPSKPEPEPEYARITQQQFDQLVAKAALVDDIRTENKQRFDAVFGQLGGIKQQVLERLQSQTEAGQPVELTAEDVADLSGQFPEIGELTLKALQKVAGKLRGTGQAPAVSSEAFERMVAERTGSVRRELIDAALDSVLPDWDKKVQQPEYAAWIAQQPDDIKRLQESDAPREAARLLRLYGAHLSKPPAPAPAPAPPAVSTRQRQLEAAVNPKSTGGHAPARTEEDEFAAGFNS